LAVLAVAALAATGLAGCSGAGVGASRPTAVRQDAPVPGASARIGIVNAAPSEQAPILAAMRVTGSQVIDGYRYYLGTIDGHPVVEVRSGEKEYAAELATALMDLHFHLVAGLLTGTAGSRNPAVNVGDVVVGAFVVDKSSIHFHRGGVDTAYTGVEMQRTRRSDVAGATIGGYGTVGPTPGDAGRYGYGPSATTKQYTYVESLAANRALVEAAVAGMHLPRTPRSEATGDSKAIGSIPGVVDVGAIGSANQWTEPLVDQEQQNALYETDAGENEGMAVAYTDAQMGVPWVLIRGISDSPWYPAAYQGVLAAERAAAVAVHLIAHFPRDLRRGPATLSVLSAGMNARRAGYLVAARTDVTAAGVSRVTYVDVAGRTVTVAWRFAREYTYGAGTAG